MDEQNDRSESLLLRLLLFPISFMLSLPPITVLVAVLLIGLLGFGVYYSFNSDFLGLATPPLAKLVFSSGYQTVRDPDGRQWVITYESDRDTIFTGIVRHVSHWREEDIPFATHDILVTTGEFSSQDRVHVSVMFHTFTYRYYEDPRPSGTINLLHIVPASLEIYRQLLEVRDWNQVSIRGREILRIERFDPQGNFLGAWQDAGCNSILVNSVQITAEGTPVP
jgi:hypothetical protein